MWLVFFAVVVLVLLLLIVAPVLLVRLFPVRSERDFGNCLLVIAHPDDECMFFAPTILSLRSPVYVLCLSNGNNHRANELRRSCLRLRVREHKIIDDPIQLKDAQSVSWSADAILGHVNQCIRQWNISTLISFDQYGVSGHRNHSSIYYALLKLTRSDHLRFLSLQSEPIYRKYLTLPHLLRTHVQPGTTRFVLPATDCFLAHKAMSEHRSQLVWFRYLYVLFSRYFWINDLKLIY